MISGQDDQITVLHHHPSGGGRTIQVMSATSATNNGGCTTQQFSYIPTGTAMLGFYNLQGVDVELMQTHTNMQR